MPTHHGPAKLAGLKPDHDRIWLPPEIRSFVTRGGKLLHPSTRDAWGWLARDVVSFPCEIEFKMADLAAYFYSRSEAMPRDWINSLVAEGLAEIVERRSGRGGFVRIRLLDPADVARLRVKRADPQTMLPIEVEPEPSDEETLGPVGGWSEGLDEDDQQTLGPVAHCAEGLAEQPPSCVAPGAPPVALVDALQSHLGAGRVEVWLKRSRWELGDVPKLYLPSEFMRDYFRRVLHREVRAAVSAAGLGDAVEYDVDPSLVQDSDPGSDQKTLGPVGGCAEGLGAQQPTMVCRSSTGASTNQPTNRAGDFWDEKDGPVPPIVAQAAALYERIGDWTLFRGVALRVAVLVAEGTLPAEHVDELVESRRHDFNVAAKQAAGRYWVPIGRFKSQLAGEEYGVNWRRRWDRPRQPR